MSMQYELGESTRGGFTEGGRDMAATRIVVVGRRNVIKIIDEGKNDKQRGR
jgi:hypothetical protein